MSKTKSIPASSTKSFNFKNISLLDDAWFTTSLDNNLKLASFILNIVLNKNDLVVTKITTQKKLTCSVCGYIYDGDTAPEKCPICNAPAEKFKMQNVSVSPSYSNNISSSSGCSIIVLIGISITLGAMFLL